MQFLKWLGFFSPSHYYTLLIIIPCSLKCRCPDSLEIRGHYAPIISLDRFVRSRYFSADNAGYSYRRAGDICPFCGASFKKGSTDYRQHVTTCLSDHPTFYEMPPRDSQYLFRRWKNALPEPFICIADIETSTLPIERVCQQCNAVIATEVNEENIMKIVKSCNHPKLQHQSCPECLNKIKTKMKAAKKICIDRKHARNNDEELCTECHKIFL